MICLPESHAEDEMRYKYIFATYKYASNDKKEDRESNRIFLW